MVGEPGQRNLFEKTLLYTTLDEVCFFEWNFECRYGGNLGGFEGASLARVSQGKILHLERCDHPVEKSDEERSKGVSTLTRRFSRSINIEDEPAVSQPIPQSGVLLFSGKVACQQIFQKERPQGFHRFGGQRG